MLGLSDIQVKQEKLTIEKGFRTECQEIIEQTGRLESQAKKVGENQGNLTARTCLSSRSLLPDTRHGHPSATGHSRHCRGGIHPMPSFALAPFATGLVSQGSLWMARHMLFALAWPPGLRVSEQLAFRPL